MVSKCAALQTRVVAQTQALLTELIFEHSLRMRVKAGVDIHTAPSVIPATGTGATQLQVPPPALELRSRSPSPATIPTRVVNGGNAVGKITNLVTTDLKTWTDASTFILLIRAYSTLLSYISD